MTASPDVTVSTNLGGWINARGVFDRRERSADAGEEGVASAQKWQVSPTGQHVELGIAENNLFLLLASLGLSGPLFGARLLPIGTLYDPFISRGLDALNHACYQDARFLLVATPSGVSLAPEGGAHQSVLTPLIGMGQPGLLAYEPAFADELAAVMRFAFEHMQADDGSSVYLRLSTRPIAQPARDAHARARGRRSCAAATGWCRRRPAPSSRWSLRRGGRRGARGARDAARGRARRGAARADLARPTPRGLALGAARAARGSTSCSARCRAAPGS